MPDPTNYDDESEWMEACVPTARDEGMPQDQAVAMCLDMWRNRNKSAAPLVTRAYSVLEVKSVDTEQRTIEGYATTPMPDRVGDIVDPMGAKFQLPMPLLWQHDHHSPVGHVTVAKTGKDGIKITAQLAKIDEPGELKNIVDKAWQSIKHKLVRGLSIGFKPLDYEMLEDGTGYKFLKWSWLELSLVTIPAQAEATISVIKSIDRGVMAALGHDGATDESKRPGVTGKSPSTSKPPVRLKPMADTRKTFAEQIAALEAKRAANEERMADIMQKSTDEGRSTDESEQDEFDGLEREIDTIDSDLKRYRKLEAVNRSKAAPVGDPKTVKEGSEARATTAPYIRVQDQLEKGIRAARAVKCMWHAYHHHRDVESVSKAMYPDDELVQKAAVAAGTTQPNSWGNWLVSPEGGVFSEFLEFLRPMTILGKFGQNGIPALTRVPFRTPLLTQTGGGQGYWVGEARAKPLTQFAGTRTTLEPLKVANIAVVTEELLRDSSPSADGLLRDQLAAALQARLDTDFISPSKTAVAGVSPASVTNGVSLSTSLGTDGDAVRRDIRAVMAKFVADNNAPTSGVWVMSSQTALSLSLMTNPLGNPEFEGISMTGGRLFGMPIITSEYVAKTAGASPSVDTWNVYLIAASQVFLGDEGQFSVDVSREASLEMADNPTNASAAGSPSAPVAASMVSMFQTNSVAFRVERGINWVKARAGAVQGLTGVRWAPSA